MSLLTTRKYNEKGLYLFNCRFLQTAHSKVDRVRCFCQSCVGLSPIARAISNWGAKL